MIYIVKKYGSCVCVSNPLNCTLKVRHLGCIQYGSTRLQLLWIFLDISWICTSYLLIIPWKVKFLCVLVLLVCDNRLSQTGWHKQKFIFLEVQDQGTSSLGFCGVLLLGLHKAVLLLCSHVAFSLCMHIPDPSSSSYKDTSPAQLYWDSPLFNLNLILITSFNLTYIFRPCLQIWSHWRVSTSRHKHWRDTVLFITLGHSVFFFFNEKQISLNF